MPSKTIKPGAVARSVKWVGFVKLFSQLAMFATTIVVLKFISKESFGLASMAYIVMGLIDVVIDFGFASAIVQRKHVSSDEYSSCFWALVLFSVAGAATLFFSSPIAAWIFNEPNIVDLLHVLSFVFVSVPVQIIYRGMLTREIRLDILAKQDLIGLILRSVVTIVLAMMNFGVWSLIYGFIAEKIFVALLLVSYSRWLPSLHMRKSEIAPFLAFGVHITMSRIIYYFLQKVDSMVVGRFFGAEILGVYSIAVQFMNVIIQLVVTISNKILLPMFSIHQDSGFLQEYVYQSIRMISYIALPAVTGLALISSDLIRLSLGDKWLEAASYMKILAIMAGIQMITLVFPQVFNAVNKPGVNVKINLFSLIVYLVTCYFFAEYWGVYGVLWATVILAVTRFGIMLEITRRIILIKRRVILIECLETVFVLLIMYVLISASDSLLNDVSVIIRLVVTVLVGFGSYVGLQLIFFRKKTIDMFRLVIRV